MKRKTDKTTRGQQGGGLIEFCFTMPVLRLIAGATIDLSRYMRFLQVTTFVSQETAGQIYRQCSDITIYTPPGLGTSTLSIDTELTTTAVQACIERIQAGAQQLLDDSLGRAAVSSKVFRWNIGQPTVEMTCAGVTSTLQSVTVINAQARLKSGEVSDDTKNKLKDADCDGSNKGRNSSSIRWSSVFMQRKGKSKDNKNKDEYKHDDEHDDEHDYEDDDEDDDEHDDLPSGLTKEGIVLRGDGIYQTKNGSSPIPRRLVSANTLCERGRVATVEVSYAFEPVVKFLPHMMIKLNTDGSQRETTVL